MVLLYTYLYLLHRRIDFSLRIRDTVLCSDVTSEDWTKGIREMCGFSTEMFKQRIKIHYHTASEDWNIWNVLSRRDNDFTIT